MRAIPDPFKKFGEKIFRAKRGGGGEAHYAHWEARLLQPPHCFHASAAIGTEYREDQRDKEEEENRN